ncbi:MAG: tetratricopeptide repeat protein [Anaerolineae bacterium]|nr:tetratricopeptide repeat protein [Anaerolineae bacterium]
MIDLTSIHELRKAGRHEQALRELTRLAANFPTDPVIQYEAASVNDFLGQEREAVEYYLAAINHGLSGDDLRGAYLGLGSTYRALGQYTESRQTLLDGIKHFPEAVELRVFLSMTAYNLAAYQDAVASLLLILADTSVDPDIKRYEQAIRLYAQDLDRRWE